MYSTRDPSSARITVKKIPFDSTGPGIPESRPIHIARFHPTMIASPSITP
jgi:hypothetical protein